MLRLILFFLIWASGAWAANYSLVAALVSSDSLPSGVLSFPTVACTGSACSGTNVDLNSSDLIYGAVMLRGGCYSSTPTVTLSSTSTTNTTTQIGTMVYPSSLGEPCAYSYWGTATAETGASFTATISNTNWNLGNSVVLIFRNSQPVTWSLPGHSEAVDNDGNITSGSLGDAVADELLIAVGAHRATGSATDQTPGLCADSVNCTLAPGTQTNYASGQYQIVAGSNNAVTASSSSATTSTTLMAVRIHATESANTVRRRFIATGGE